MPTTTSSEPAPARDFARQCLAHWWPLRADGTCARCDAAAERMIALRQPCPPVDTWPRALRLEVLRQHELRTTQHPMTDETQRRQASWEQWLYGAAEDLGVIPRRGAPTPIRDVYAKLVAHLNPQGA
ncbi:hypothetical protein tb265_39330 [Gemmatimonadetes bacterium T265]|nr:hypothetical protein tb265_39330 [Gemmatimonadetes bacterium T265]